MKAKNILLATRFPFISASVLPSIFTITWIWIYKNEFHLIYSILTILGIIFVHLLANTINDYFDWDASDKINEFSGPFSGGSRKKLENILSKNTFLILAFIFLLLSLLILLFFILNKRPLVIYIGIAGALIGILYSTPPLSLQSRGLGEIFIFLAFGPCITLGTGYAITGNFDYIYLLLGIPNGILTTMIIVINEFPDYKADKESGKKNSVVRFGFKISLYIYTALHVLYYFSILILFIMKLLPIIIFILYITIPLSALNIKSLFKNYQEPLKLIPAQAQTIQLQMISNILIIVTLFTVFFLSKINIKIL